MVPVGSQFRTVVDKPSHGDHVLIYSVKSHVLRGVTSTGDDSVTVRVTCTGCWTICEADGFVTDGRGSVKAGLAQALMSKVMHIFMDETEPSCRETRDVRTVDAIMGA